MSKRKKTISQAEIMRRRMQTTCEGVVPIDPETRLPIIGHYSGKVPDDEIDENLNSKSIMNIEV